jgi:membrane-associated protein
VGAVLWVATFSAAGFLFGDIPAIKGNLSLITIGLVVVTVLPTLIGILRTPRAPRSR